jgi:hypothetical protein
MQLGELGFELRGELAVIGARHDRSRRSGNPEQAPSAANSFG